ncbi:MAG: inositol phosphate phosphatase SopB [Plesiomonas sp.]|uniref:inositol phosphate phosphatase SopB n=1 Tax=Plesiomonas sp. TaxID=2486279 RepID=UPI003F35F306
MTSYIRFNYFSKIKEFSLPDSCADKKNKNIIILNFSSIRPDSGLPPSKSEVLLTEKKQHSGVDVKNKVKQNRGETYSLGDILNFKNQIIDIAEMALGSTNPALNQIKNTIQLPEISAVNCDKAASHKDVYMASRMQNIVIGHLANDLKHHSHNNIAMSEARLAAADIYKKTRVTYLNNRPWNTIEKTFVQNNNEYISKQQPAAEMKKGEHDIFPTSYNGKGINCWDTSNTEHATNLWRSTVSVKTEDGKEKELFNGIRHGVLSPIGVKNPQERHRGAVNRAKEVVSAALFSKPALLERALSGEVVPLRLVSTSLLTPTGLFGKEDIMLRDQIQAWQTLNQSGSPLTLDIKDTGGNLRKVKIAFEVAAFNFGVNELSLKFGLGNKTSDNYNHPALRQLLGKDLKPESAPGGWVGEYLSKNPENAGRVKELSQQIKTIWQNKSHHSDNGEPYKLAQRVTMLANEINSIPCWNCKSGKDRTGMLDVEIKREAISLHQGNPLSKLRKSLDQNGKWLLQQVLLNSGNLEVQAQNTGLAGNKILKNIGISLFNLSYKDRIDNNQVWYQSQGMSKLVSS